MPHFNFTEGEPGAVVLEVRGNRERPSVAWAGHTYTMKVYDYGDNTILGSSSAAVENEAANDLGGWDFDLVAAMPDVDPGYHRADFHVLDGASLAAILPHRFGALTVRVWEAGAAP